MEVRIKNHAKHLLLVTLSSRTTFHLAPGEVSPPVNDSEVSQNTKVAKLASSGLISILRPAGQNIQNKFPQ